MGLTSQNRSFGTCHVDTIYKIGEIMLNNMFSKENKNSKQYIYLSKIKLDVLKHILAFSLDKHYSPTFAEVARRFRFSRARVGKIVSELFLMGFITKGKSAHRNIRIDDHQKQIIEDLQFNREYPVKATIN